MSDQLPGHDLHNLSQVVEEVLHERADRDGVLLLTGQGPQRDRVELVYDERVVDASLTDLVTTAEAAGGTHALQVLIRDWYDARPVCDAEAAACGVALLAEDMHGQMMWQAHVARGNVSLPWVPSPWLSKTAVARIRRACTWRSGLVVAAPVRRGNTAVWQAIPQEAGTAVLTNPDRMIDQMRQVGLLAVDPCAVVSSAGTVVAAERSAAHRLAEQVSAPVVHVLPLKEPMRFQWR